jgi:hypothetical protein
MHRDPRNPIPDYMVSSGSTHSFHSNLRKTLSLLSIQRATIGMGPIYFVVEGLSEWPLSLDEMNQHQKYFYEQHTCPTNFIRIPLIAVDGDVDPHGIFEFVEAVWMMDEYDSADCDEYLCEVFPQIKSATA